MFPCASRLLRRSVGRVLVPPVKRPSSALLALPLDCSVLTHPTRRQYSAEGTVTVDASHGTKRHIAPDTFLDPESAAHTAAVEKIFKFVADGKFVAASGRIESLSVSPRGSRLIGSDSEANETARSTVVAGVLTRLAELLSRPESEKLSAEGLPRLMHLLVKCRPTAPALLEPLAALSTTTEQQPALERYRSLLVAVDADWPLLPSLRNAVYRLTAQGSYESAAKYLHLWQTAFTVNPTDFSALLERIRANNLVDEFLRVLDQMQRDGSVPLLLQVKLAMSLCGFAGYVDRLPSLFAQWDALDRRSIVDAFNSCLEAHAKVGDLAGVISLADLMQQRRLIPTTWTIAAVSRPLLSHPLFGKAAAALDRKYRPAASDLLVSLLPFEQAEFEQFIQLLQDQHAAAADTAARAARPRQRSSKHKQAGERRVSAPQSARDSRAQAAAQSAATAPSERQQSTPNSSDQSATT